MFEKVFGVRVGKVTFFKSILAAYKTNYFKTINKYNPSTYWMQ